MRILHTNDLHGALPGPAMERLRLMRTGCDLYVDSGDLIRTGNLGVPLRPEPAWAALAELRCDAGTLGNRETHPVEAAFMAKLNGAGHPLVCANVRRKDGVPFLPPSVILDVGRRKVGIVGVMVPMVTERMRTQGLSAFLWDPPIPAAAAEVERIAPECTDVFVLSHVGHRTDREMALRLPRAAGAILGGHSHTVLLEPELVGEVYVAQAGSHGRYAGVYDWDGERLSGRLEALR